MVCSTITYWFGEQASGQASGQVSGTASGIVSRPIQLLINMIAEGSYGISDLQKMLNISSRRYIRESMLNPAIEAGYVLRAYPDQLSHPQQRYYLSEMGLKLVK